MPTLECMPPRRCATTFLASRSSPVSAGRQNEVRIPQLTTTQLDDSRATTPWLGGGIGIVVVCDFDLRGMSQVAENRAGGVVPQNVSGVKAISRQSSRNPLPPLTRRVYSEDLFARTSRALCALSAFSPVGCILRNASYIVRASLFLCSRPRVSASLKVASGSPGLRISASR